MSLGYCSSGRSDQRTALRNELLDSQSSLEEEQYDCCMKRSSPPLAGTNKDADLVVQDCSPAICKAKTLPYGGME